MLVDTVTILAPILDGGIAQFGHDVEEGMRRGRDELLIFPQGFEFLPSPGRGIDDPERPCVANGVILRHSCNAYCNQCSGSDRGGNFVLRVFSMEQAERSFATDDVRRWRTERSRQQRKKILRRMSAL